MGLLAWWRHHLQNEANRRIIGVLPNPRRERFLAEQAAHGQATAAQRRSQAAAGFHATDEGRLAVARADTLNAAGRALRHGDTAEWTHLMELYNELLVLTDAEYADLTRPESA